MIRVVIILWVKPKGENFLFDATYILDHIRPEASCSFIPGGSGSPVPLDHTLGADAGIVNNVYGFGFPRIYLDLPQI